MGLVSFQMRPERVCPSYQAKIQQEDTASDHKLVLTRHQFCVEIQIQSKDHWENNNYY